MGDDRFRLEFALSMLDHVVLELAGFAFALALGNKWLSPVPVQVALNLGAIAFFNTHADVPTSLKQEGILSLGPDEVAADPALIALRLAVQAVQATLAKPEYLDSFRSAERKSRYLESDAVVKAFAQMLLDYDAYLAKPGNFAEWWNQKSSPIRSMQTLLTK